MALTKVQSEMAGAGQVLQVVNLNYATEVTTTNSFVDTGLTATITPKFATSKILVLVNQNGLGRSAGGNSGDDITLRLYRGASIIATPAIYSMYTGAAANWYGMCTNLSYLDSPATTSATTYKTTFTNSDGVGTVYVQRNGSMSTITLLEIAQ